MSGTNEDPGDMNGDDELARLREIFAQSPSFSALLHGPDHLVVLANPAYQQLVGRPVIGRIVREAFPEVEAQGFLDLLDEVFSTGKPFVGRDIEIVFNVPHGGAPKTRFLDFVYQPIKNAAGNVTSIFVEGSDQTQRHLTENALRASEARLRALNLDLERQVIERAQARSLTWQLSPDLLGALNLNGYFETSNPAWRTILGWSEAEVASMSIFELLHPDDLEHTRAGFELTLVGQPALRFINRYRCKDGGYRWISWIGIQEDGFVYCTGRDITAEKMAEMELAEAQDALRQSQKMEAIGQLTGGIAHDFNNLLTGILGSLDLIRRRMATATRPEDIPRFMDAATTSAHRAAALTHRLLAFARRQSLDSKPNDVNRLIVSIEDLLRRTLGERIQLHSQLAAELWAAFIDANQLENAILNLVINSRDAMPDGGILTISTANAPLTDTYTSRHEGLEPGDYVVIRVADTGIGMSPEVAAKATDPFFTTKKAGEGTGLGLSMISGFARQSRGHLHIRSQVGQGTTIELYLPRALQDAIELNVPTVVTPRGQGETILVVEDDATVRVIITDVLEELGYVVFSAPDARAAIPMLQSNQSIHLMVSDVVLPHINGRKLAEIARTTLPALKVLFVSGYAEAATLRADFLDSGMDMLTKPFALDVLGAKVRMLIEPQAATSPP
jgi:PAS domain S-box-containing protein